MDIFHLSILSLFTFSLAVNTYRHAKNAIEIKKILSESSPTDIKRTFHSQIFSSLTSLGCFIVFLCISVTKWAEYFKNFGPESIKQLGMTAGFLIFSCVFFYLFFKWVKKQEDKR